MNTINSLINQQLGMSKWSNYDVGIHRLACTPDEDYQWIFSNLVWSSLDTPIFACKFAQVQGYQHILALANEDGKIAICNTETGGPRVGGSAHNNAIFDLAWMPKKMKLVSASGDHTAALFNCENGGIEVEQVFHGHTRSLKTVACRVNDFAVFATGGRDGKIIIWDSRANVSNVMMVAAPDICLPYAHHHPSQIKKIPSKSGKLQPLISGSNSVTGLVFQDADTLISCGAGDGLIKVWDLRKNYYISDRAAVAKYSLPYAGTTLRNGFSNLLLSSNGTKLYASCLDNTIYCYNVSTYHPKPVMKYVGHKNTTFYVKSSLSSDEMYILSGSSDNNAYIWNVAHPEPIVKLEGHEAEVTCVAWCPKSYESVLVTCSDDLHHRIWRVGLEVVPEKTNEPYYASRAVVQPKPKVSAYRTLQKRTFDDLEENLHPDDMTKFCAEQFHEEHRCTHSSCRRIFWDEYFMVARNRDLRREIERTMELHANRKRKHLNHLDLNVPSTSESGACDDDHPTLAKRLKTDPSYGDGACIEDDDDSDSPTSNLPNFVADGTAPHLITSPLKKQEKDWLTKLRLERLSMSDIQELSTPTSQKVQKTDGKKTDNKNPQPKSTNNKSPLPKSPGTKGRLHKNVKAQESSTNSAQSPLLKFFKLTNRTVVIDNNADKN